MIWLLNDEDNRVGKSNKIEQDILDKSCVSLEDFKNYAKSINNVQKDYSPFTLANLKSSTTEKS